MFKIQELEKLLIKHWFSFLDVRKLLEYATSTAKNKLKIQNPKVTTLSVSHCELKTEGLLFWIDYKILDGNEVVNATTEFILKIDGSLVHIKTI